MGIEATVTKTDSDTDSDPDPDENAIAEAEFPIAPMRVIGKPNLALCTRDLCITVWAQALGCVITRFQRLMGDSHFRLDPKPGAALDLAGSQLYNY
jgi:hypothetical protein